MQRMLVLRAPKLRAELNTAVHPLFGQRNGNQNLLQNSADILARFGRIFVWSVCKQRMICDETLPSWRRILRLGDRVVSQPSSAVFVVKTLRGEMGFEKRVGNSASLIALAA
jgi:hypothetical protein